MKTIWVITQKELGDYFKSFKAYIILLITLSVFNVFFFMILEQNREASLRDMFKLMEFLFIFIIPILTMSLLAEEKRVGTMEFLLTAPIRTNDIVLGKFLGAAAFLTVLLVLTSVYYIVLEIFGDPDRLAIFSGYCGIFLEGLFFVAVGLLTSSWTKNQVIAALSSYAIIFAIYFSITFIQYFEGPINAVIRYLSVWSHTENFSAGLILTSDLVYFLSAIGLSLGLTCLSLKRRA